MLKSLHKTVILVCLPVVCLGAPPEIPPQKTIDLLDENTGVMAAMEGDRVIALYGVPFAVNDAELGVDVDVFVQNWLFEDSFNGKSGHKDALGVPDVDLVPDDDATITSADGRFKVYRYYEMLDDLRVVDSAVTIPVLLAVGQTPDRIGYIGMAIWPEAQTCTLFFPVPETGARNTPEGVKPLLIMH